VRIEFVKSPHAEEVAQRPSRSTRADSGAAPNTFSEY
jgi:hypothetical protein